MISQLGSQRGRSRRERVLLHPSSGAEIRGCMATRALPPPPFYLVWDPILRMALYAFRLGLPTSMNVIHTISYRHIYPQPNLIYIVPAGDAHVK